MKMGKTGSTTPPATSSFTLPGAFMQANSTIQQFLSVTKLYLTTAAQVYLPLLLLPLLFVAGCSKKAPTNPVDVPVLAVTPEDASCTEAWVRVQITNPESLQWIRLQVNDTERGYLLVNSRDTVLLIDSLPVNKRSTIKISGCYLDEHHKSITLDTETAVMTLDTSSHNYQFNSWLFGGKYSDCAIWDIAITPANEIWVLCDIIEADTSAGSAFGLYTSLMWKNGSWFPYNYYFFDSIRNHMSLMQCRSIFSSPAGKVLFTGGSLFEWDGKKVNLIFNGLENYTGQIFSFELVWQFGDGELYGFDNYQKQIIYRKNNIWKHLGSRPETVNSVYGNDRNELILAAETRVLWMEGGKIVNKLDLPERTVAYSVWFKRKHRVYLAGSGLFKLEGGKIVQERAIENRGLTKVVGTDYNNLWCVGDHGYLAHFNGVSWKVYNGLPDGLSYCLAVSKGKVLYGGILPPRAQLIMGTEY